MADASPAGRSWMTGPTRNGGGVPRHRWLGSGKSAGVVRTMDSKRRRREQQCGEVREARKTRRKGQVLVAGETWRQWWRSVGDRGDGMEQKHLHGRRGE